MLSQKPALHPCVVAVPQERALAFAMPTLSGHTEDTVTWWRCGKEFDLRSGSTCARHFPTAKNVLAANTSPHVKAALEEKAELLSE